jgi:hypothetical protein
MMGLPQVQQANLIGPIEQRILDTNAEKQLP